MFALTNANLDASIAAWDAKRAFDSVRPVTAICFLLHDQLIRAWGGPGKGTVEIDGSQWIPYQPTSLPTPSFPEYVSGHSTFSAASASILQRFTGSSHFGASVDVKAGSSLVEPGLTPVTDIHLEWSTFANAANEAGISRRYGGIHFKTGDLAGRALGVAVAAEVWQKATDLWNDRDCH